MYTTTITTKTRLSRPGALMIALGVLALAIPASASAFYGPAPEKGSVPNSGSSDSGLVIPDHTSLNASLNAAVTPERSSPNSDSGYTSLNAITPPVGEPSTGSAYTGSGYTSPPAGSPGGPLPDEPTFASSPVSGDGFDWADAALGAGVAMALVTLGGAALLTVRRRTTITPSGSAS